MFFGDADANTSAGAPLMIWVARAELAPKLNVTFTPGLAASNCLPMVVKASFSEAAANTVIDPDNDAEEEAEAEAEVLPLVDEELAVLLLLDEQPARADAVIPAIAAAMTVTAIRRTMTPMVQISRGENQRAWGISTDTFVDLTAAMASMPGSRPSSSAASRLSSDTNLCGPAWISTWAITVSRTTRVTRPGNRLRSD